MFVRSNATREQVISEAETWIGTPHHNGAKIKGVGVDCGMLPIAVYTTLGLIEDPKPERYPHDFHLHRDREWYMELADAAGKLLPEGELPKPGDFALYKIGRIYSHGAIIVEWPRIIHAFVAVGVIYDVGDQGRLADGKPRFYTLW